MTKRKATAEAPPPTTKAANTSKRQRGVANAPSKKTAAPAVEDDEDEDVPAEGDDSVQDVDWDNEPELTDTLLAFITDDEDNIRTILFPPKGKTASTQKGGGKKKVEFHYKAAEKLFKEHPKYKDDFAKAMAWKPRTKRGGDYGKGSLKAAWARKIKNRLKNLIAEMKKWLAELGETGKGLECREQIDFSKTGKWMNMYMSVEEKFPWFWDVRHLVESRPSVIPTGVGNSTSDIDMSAVQPNANATNSTMAADIPASTSGTRAQSAEVADGLRNGPALLEACGFKDVEDADEEDELDQLDEDGDGGNKEQSPQTTVTRPSKRAGRENDSITATTPTTTTSPAPPIKSSDSSQLKQKATHKAKKDEFSDLATSMELSVQKQLDLERVKAEAATKIRIVKEKATIDAKLQLKMQKQRLRHELKMEKMKLEMRRIELEAARSNAGAGHGAASWGFVGEPGSASINSSRISSPAFVGSESFSAGDFDVEGDGGIEGASQTFFGGNDENLDFSSAHQFT